MTISINNIIFLSLFGLLSFFLVQNSLRLNLYKQMLRGRVLGWATLIIFFIRECYWLNVGFDLKISLPLFTCDFALLSAPFALIWGFRFSRTLLYFWGLILASQALLFPSIAGEATKPDFWLFYAGHIAVFWSALYDLAVMKYRPRIPDVKSYLAFSGWYAAVMSMFNIHFEANYAFIGPTSPLGQTPVDLLGPWPGRVILVYSIYFVVAILGWAVWKIPSVVRLFRLKQSKSQAESQQTLPETAY